MNRAAEAFRSGPQTTRRAIIRRRVMCVAWVAVFCGRGAYACAVDNQDDTAADAADGRLKKVVAESFAAMHDGWSSDEVIEFPAHRVASDPSQVSTGPGIYIFRDRTGYLYIGESGDLRERLNKHLDHSDRQSLARYLREQGAAEITIELHAFDPDSRAKEVMVRKAYESELIRSRRPRFNIAP